jgi:hypothetical protein
MYEQNHPQQNLPPQHQPPPNPPQKSGSAWWGIGLTLLLHVLQIPIAIGVSMVSSDPYSFIVPLIFFSLTQLVYMVPAVLIAMYAGKPHIVKGLLIGAGISMLLNASCAGLFMLPNF